MFILIINMTDGCDRDKSFFTSYHVRININNNILSHRNVYRIYS